ncbi:MAG TPA: phage tail protein [Sphingomicrobium sp.]|nr:phage tail protein [Sphingomicrobium sp.]
MATLVLSTVGTALGGPVGGAIGALIGQSLDQQLLAPASRGLRLGDLSVQTSSYGTEIPRIYGSMRVAGTVVWATDLVQSEQTTGAKGQPDVTYSYSVSLAVAVSSRVVGTIGRVWADGKLLRGAEGDFKVPVTFRFYSGDENQQIDPLIGSIEGIANTPAYRALAIAVFENLELAAFGNRIPFMTFEAIADPAPPSVSTILNDASAGSIASDAAQAVVGYAAYGRSIAAAVQPLVDCFGPSLFDDGSTLRPPLDLTPIAVDPNEFGNSADGQKVSKLQREQLPVRTVPSTLRLTYYDPDLDYQTGEARATAGDPNSNEVQQELPAVLSAGDAKTLVQQMLARQWSARDKVTLRLPPARLGLEPGSIAEPGLTPSSWIVDKCTIDSFVAVVELRPSWQPSAALIAESGRIVPNNDVVAAPTSLALIEAPSMTDAQASGPTVLIAASSPNEGWGSRTLVVSGSGQTFVTQTAARKSVLGRALTELASADPFLIDEVNSVDVQLVDPQQWITSCDPDALADGVNLAVLGSELVQFGDALPLGQGRFRLAQLLRGRGGTEWATSMHSVDEPFCLLDSNSLRPLSLPVWMRGSAVTVSDQNGSSASFTFAAESVRPLAPDNLSASFDAGGDLTLGWRRRSRNGFAWLDEVDAPIGETREQYSVTIAAAASILELTVEEASAVIAASDLASLGSGTASVEVRQLGDWAASRSTQLTIDLP